MDVLGQPIVPFLSVQESKRKCHSPKYGLSFGFLNPEDGNDKLSRNIGKKLPLPTA